jgi:hypothetical protein
MDLMTRGTTGLIQPADLHGEGVWRDLVDVEVLLPKEVLVQRGGAPHREVGSVPEVLRRLPGQVRRPVRGPEPLHCTHASMRSSSVSSARMHACS